uniref:Retrotransposon gag domain-containing protein n=1 Tax=Rhodosorus marinus TaxID=101924 RepID=A0A7S2ZQZ9_9RHOD|mmetsp:Transcript_29148/g.113194  ORF Transcript_29148/g.113194 Transcript_29148/m.113194 type:complete len:113 (+) Transcript_29148:86-424(+)
MSNQRNLLNFTTRGVILYQCNQREEKKEKRKYKSALIKIQAPQPRAYDGKRDALQITTFLNNLRTYFKLARLSEDDDEYKVNLAEGYLTGDASYWWSLLPEHQRPTTYDGFG